MTDSPYKGKDFKSGESNIIRLPTEKPKKTNKFKPAGDRDTPSPPPAINLPPVTKKLLALLIGIHIIVTLILPEEMAHWIILHLGFIPGRFTGAAPFEPIATLSLVTHLFLHGGWIHLGMNAVMLAAFGAGIEKWLGAGRFLALAFFCGLIGALAHFAFNPFSIVPVIGASGALSGLFAAALIMLQGRQNSEGQQMKKYGVLPFVVLWIGISVVFGMLGTPDGAGSGTIAWAAHVGGFLGGFAVLKFMRVF